MEMFAAVIERQTEDRDRADNKLTSGQQKTRRLRMCRRQQCDRVDPGGQLNRLETSRILDLVSCIYSRVWPRDYLPTHSCGVGLFAQSVFTPTTATATATLR